MGYVGSEEFIRLQFEEYLLALLSSMKYHLYLYSTPTHLRDPHYSDIEGDPAADFNLDWVDAWAQTANFALFNKYTDSHLFDIVEPKHPTAGGLSMDDINRRLTLQVQELHLDERLAKSREALNKHLATGQKKVSSAFNHLWADIEAMREAQRQRNLPNPTSKPRPSTPTATAPDTLPSPSTFTSPLSPITSSSPRPHAPSRFDPSALRARAPDLSHAQASVTAAGQKAGAYISSWGAWASEKKKGWGSAKDNDGGSGGGGGSGIKERAEGEVGGVKGGREKERKRQERGEDGIGRLDA